MVGLWGYSHAGMLKKLREVVKTFNLKGWRRLKLIFCNPSPSADKGEAGGKLMFFDKTTFEKAFEMTPGPRWGQFSDKILFPMRPAT